MKDDFRRAAALGCYFVYSNSLEFVTYPGKSARNLSVHSSRRHGLVYRFVRFGATRKILFLIKSESRAINLQKL